MKFTFFCKRKNNTKKGNIFRAHLLIRHRSHMRSILFIIFIYFFCGVAYLLTFYHIDSAECVPIKPLRHLSAHIRIIKRESRNHSRFTIELKSRWTISKRLMCVFSSINFTVVGLLVLSFLLWFSFISHFSLNVRNLFYIYGTMNNDD